MQHKLLLFRCRCPEVKRAPEIRVKRSGDWYHAYLYHKPCGNVEFLFKWRVTQGRDALFMELKEPERATPIPRDFLRGGSGDIPLLEEEYEELQRQQIEDAVKKMGDPDL